MAKSRKELTDEFVENSEKGDHSANDDLVRDVDPRDPFVIDAQ